ncbi:PaaI family thioesterase [Rhodobacteraceae bacterium XHP0102]|nr:PaaI family thioesterase [Rhodobacteraceae bacterium XHP0102]
MTSSSFEDGTVPPDQADHIHVAQSFITRLPFAAALQMQLVDLGSAYAVMEMPVLPQFLDANGRLHEGALSALMDTCAGTAVVAHESRPLGTATLDLRLDFISAPMQGRVRTVAQCDALCADVAFVSVQATDLMTGALVAKANGSFAVEYGAQGQGFLDAMLQQKGQG